MTGLLFAHRIELGQRFVEAAHRNFLEPIELLFQRSRRRTDHAWQPQDRREIRFSLDAEFLAQRINGLHV